MKAKRLIWVGGTLVCVLAIAFTFLSVRGERMFRLRSAARKHWKETALTEIAQRAKDYCGLSNELNQLRAEMATYSEAGWIGTNLLVVSPVAPPPPVV